MGKLAILLGRLASSVRILKPVLAPVVRAMKPIWKAGLISIIQGKGDELQAVAERELLAHGQDYAAAVISRWAQGIGDGIRMLPIPEKYRDSIIAHIYDEGVRLTTVVLEKKDGDTIHLVVNRFSRVFDEAQAAIIEKIRAI